MPVYVEAFNLAKRLGRPVQEIAAELGMPTEAWYWVPAAQVVMKAEMLAREAELAELRSKFPPRPPTPQTRR